MVNDHDLAGMGSDVTLGYLQELLLSATLLGERLPGSRKPVRLSTRSGNHLQPPTRILRTNLAASLKLDDLPRHLQAISPEQLAPLLSQSNNEDRSFLAFQPAEWMSDRVEISMVIGTMQEGRCGWRCREVGRVQVVFHQVEGRWSTLGEPHMFIAPEQP